VTMNLLAITLLGFKFSGTLALGVAVVVVIIIGLVWFVSTRQRRG
jgi:type IV secretory pathway VirB2 component (pilin)